MSTPFLPSTLPLLPLHPPQILYPHLQVTITLPSSHLALVLDSISDNARDQKVEDSVRMLAVVPVVEIERRIGRWACGEWHLSRRAGCWSALTGIVSAAKVKRIEKSKKEDDVYMVTLEGLVSCITELSTQSQR